MKCRVVMALVLVGSALSITPRAGADCSGPIFEVDDRRITAGDQLRITGSGWGDACNDTGGPGCDPPPLGEPIQDVTIMLRNKATRETVEVATVDADDEYAFEVVVEIRDIPRGRYVVTDDRNKGSFSGPPLRVH